MQAGVRGGEDQGGVLAVAGALWCLAGEIVVWVVVEITADFQ